MKGAIITVDVSKGNCHYQGFLDKGKPFRKPRVLYDTKQGFADLTELCEKVKQKVPEQEVVPVVFEATGCYHRPLQKFLDDNSWPYYIISPLQSAKSRQTDIHGNKTDALDCTNIANAYYQLEKLRVHKIWSEQYRNLQKLNRSYEDELQHLRKRKVKFRTVLDIVFPLMDKAFKGHASLYDPVVLEVLKKYPHPDLLLKHKEETIVKAVVKKANHKPAYVAGIVHKMYVKAQECYSGCDADDYEALTLPKVIENLQEQLVKCDELLDQIVEAARKIPYFDNIVSIIGIGQNLASRILAEIGDVSRFDTKNQLIAYAGLDPKIRESGQVDGNHLRISKKGNRHLRCLLYIGASCNYRLKRGDPLYEFNKKKRQQSSSPLKKKAANIAAAHKLLAIISGLCKTDTMYQF